MADLRATYRLQLGPGLTFAEARELVPYLRDLGISHLYLSPSFQARSGSTHGYDVCDPSRMSNELGGEEALAALVDAVRAARMGIVMDIVPNHMAASDENRFWADEDLRRKFFDIDPETGRHRRFFDIDDLAGLRIEDPEVFAATQSRALELVKVGWVDGLRIDHPDGLADPAGYLRRLHEGGAEHVWVEKILETGEPLRDWPVEGTVGYEFLNDLQGLFIDPAGEAPLTALWEEIAGSGEPFEEVALAAKLEQARTTFQPELERVRRAWPEAPPLEEPLSRLPVYRTYVEPWSGRVDEEDREAVAEADMPPELARALLLEDRGHDEFVVRVQQTTGPLMAKGVEDTAFYRYLRLLALNEVGGNPGRFGLSVDDFHAGNAQRAERFPRGLLTTQTHDTKRSGDVRARIGALAGMAEEWCAWARAQIDFDSSAPDPPEQYLVLQTLIGAWPIEAERLDGYLEKALREAKRNTNWVDQNTEHEGRVQAWARRLMEDESFLKAFRPLAEKVAASGERAALGQTLLKLTCPGLPDIYQGDELEALSLVDPDNRRPVDWAARRAALEAADPPPKMRLIRAALALRARRPEAFAGAYAPVDAGPDCVAFTRGDDDVFVGVRLRGEGPAPAPPGEGWTDALEGQGPGHLALFERA